MKAYNGIRVPNESCEVVVTESGKPDRKLDPRHDLYNHSPDGFEWGYHGSGPAQLALAILADATGDGQLAVRLHQKFKEEYVSRFGHSWELFAVDVRYWVLEQGEIFDDAIMPVL